MQFLSYYSFLAVRSLDNGCIKAFGKNIRRGRREGNGNFEEDVINIKK